MITWPIWYSSHWPHFQTAVHFPHAERLAVQDTSASDYYRNEALHVEARQVDFREEPRSPSRFGGLMSEHAPEWSVQKPAARNIPTHLSKVQSSVISFGANPTNID